MLKRIQTSITHSRMMMKSVLDTKNKVTPCYKTYPAGIFIVVTLLRLEKYFHVTRILV
jgi:hypothetical protein